MQTVAAVNHEAQLNNDTKIKREHVVIILVGAAVNQDGRSGSLTAPRGPSQGDVINLALLGCLIRVSSLQMHGTGTALGDPVELTAAFSSILSTFDRNTIHFSLDAVKTRCGHGETAAGLTSLTASLHQLSGLDRTASIFHVRTLNPHIEHALGVHISQVLRQHASTFDPFATGVSSFAFQGTNAHVIVHADLSQNTWPLLAISVCTATFGSFDRVRYWPTPMQMASGIRMLMLNSSNMNSPGTEITQIFACPGIAPDTLDHVVGGRSILPGAAFIEITHAVALACANHSSEITISGTNQIVAKGLTISRPLQLKSAKILPSLQISISTGGKISVEADKRIKTRMLASCKMRSSCSVANYETASVNFSTSLWSNSMHFLTAHVAAKPIQVMDTCTLDSCFQSAQHIHDFTTHDEDPGTRINRLLCLRNIERAFVRSKFTCRCRHTMPCTDRTVFDSVFCNINARQIARASNWLHCESHACHPKYTIINKSRGHEKK